MHKEQLSNLIRSLEENALQIEKEISDIDSEFLTWKPSEKAFSVLENICHLRDIEREGYGVRIEKIVSENSPVLPDIDGEKLAQERAYNHQDIVVALKEYISARKENINKLRSLSLDQMRRMGTLDNVGEITLGQLIEKMGEHDKAHLKELSDLRDQIMNLPT
jgi:hypothetical protein